MDNKKQSKISLRNITTKKVISMGMTVDAVRGCSHIMSAAGGGGGGKPKDDDC